MTAPRLYALALFASSALPFAKDRLGLILIAGSAGCEVRFVAPHGPSEAAGFAVGDTVASIDAEPCAIWPQDALSGLRYGAAGTTVAFTMADGRVRRVTLVDYF